MKKNGQQPSLPDFKQLNDRLIAEASPEPKLVIKTNLDPDNVAEENPYIQGKEFDMEKMNDYFNDTK